MWRIYYPFRWVRDLFKDLFGKKRIFPQPVCSVCGGGLNRAESHYRMCTECMWKQRGAGERGDL